MIKTTANLTLRQKQAERLRRRRRALRRKQRRGVLLLVVLSMLVLFLLIGTTFVVTTASYRGASRAVEQKHETSLQPGDRLERALLQVLRDTNNPHSAIRYHSLLRDVYGTDGFVGHVYAGTPEVLQAALTGNNSIGPHTISADDLNNIGYGFTGPQLSPTGAFDAGYFCSRYAGATDVTNPNPLGPTRGQLIDIYIQDDVGLDNTTPGVLADPDNNIGLRPEYVVDLELNADGETTNHRLSRTGGYYNGCLLTVLEGPAKGQTTRIVQYDYFITNPAVPPENLTAQPRNVARFRVLAFPRSDGTPLVLGMDPVNLQSNGATPNDLIYAEDTGNPLGTINNNDPFYGVRVMVNGRPNNGAGVGLNQFAGMTDPKLSALELVQLINSQNPADIGLPQYAEFAPAALLPNAIYHQPLSPSSITDPTLAPGSVFARAFDLSSALDYGLFPGDGGSDESYDAADFQNMFLALQSLSPRARGRVVNPTNGAFQEVSGYYTGGDAPNAPLGLLLDDVPIPSFHRPALVNYWMHRIVGASWLSDFTSEQQIMAVLQPYGPNRLAGDGDDPLGAGNVALAAQIAAIKRKISLRPLQEDHPNFDGSNPSSTGSDLPDLQGLGETQLASGGQITFPYWEATGPWDVDNDNDGVPDSIWVDLGDPVQKTGDGRLYKPLYAILIEDLDGRLNVNEHGAEDHLVGPRLDPSNDGSDFLVDSPKVSFDPSTNQVLAAVAGNLPVSLRGVITDQAEFDAAVQRSLSSTDQLPHGSGWGPGDISLRSILSPQLITTSPANVGDPEYDDYARLMYGRLVPSVTNPNAAVAAAINYGRYGAVEATSPATGDANRYATLRANGNVSPPSPGVNFVDAQAPATIEQKTSFELYDYPSFATAAVDRLVDGTMVALPIDTTVAARENSIAFLDGDQPSGFATAPDLKSRYAMPGLSYGGQPFDESASDASLPTLVVDSPYELRVMGDSRRGPPSVYSATENDDAPFSPAELERILRASDPDAGRLPARLWEIVDAFDADKLIVQNNSTDPLDATTLAAVTSQVQFEAQLEAAARRRAVTTDSREIPVPGDNWTSRLVFGADGRPGLPLVDDDGDGFVDNDGDETAAAIANGATVSDLDDYFFVMGVAPPTNARLIDYLRYRVTLELKRQGVIALDVLPDSNRALVNAAGRIEMDAAESQINLVLYGNNFAAASDVRGDNSNPVFASYGGLVAPEVVAGLKMDLNRPFGDGRDNNGNGVVDEPAEAGEPWIDTNGDGQWNNEPYRDLDGDGRFYADFNGNGVAAGDTTVDANINDDDWLDLDGDGIEEPIVDSLFAKQLGFPAPFDHVGGVDANGRGMFIDTTANEQFDFSDNNSNGVFEPQLGETSEPLVQDNGRMARQLYARHLYCLMLALSDDNYLAPYDDNDPQVLNYIDPDAESLKRVGNAGSLVREESVAHQIKDSLMARDASLSEAEASALARTRALRKLTCRRIAQWAINCADMRDSDAIMTPFEYDENPWDGWNVADSENGQVYPIDGDPATDENNAVFTRVTVGGWLVETGTPVAAHEQTCGVVWGVERPEMIMTEGLALHDRRVEDLFGAGDVGDVGQNDAEGNPITVNTGLIQNDNDLDQRLRPRGSAFVELFNPWDGASQHPAELYRNRNGLPRYADLDKDGQDADGNPIVDSDNDGTPDSLENRSPNLVNEDLPLEGVLLDRLSNATAPLLDENGDPRVDNFGNPLPDAASPVWRMICIEEHPDMRNDDPYDAPLAEGASAYPERSTTSSLSRHNFVFSGYNTFPGGVLSETDRTVIGATGGGNDFDNRQLPLTWHQPGTLNYVTNWRADNRKEVASPLRMTDPDFPTFDPYETPQLRRTTGVARRVVYIKPKAYVEREWYFTRGLEAVNSVTIPGSVDISMNPSAVPLCIPVRPLKLNNGADIVPGTGNAEELQFWPDQIKTISPPGATPKDLAIYPWRFPPVELDQATGAYRSVRPAPLLPGRYAVVGSAGVQYRGAAGVLPQHERRYTTTVGRKLSSGDPTWEHPFKSGTLVDSEVTQTRRIELIPNPNPHLHQVAVAMNGGDECRVMQTGPNGVYVFNATDPSSFPSDPADPAGSRVAESLKAYNEDASTNSFYNLAVGAYGHYAIKPAIAVPVEGMNISEPLDSYFFRKAELDESGAFPLDWKPNEEAGEGRYASSLATETVTAYDEPFDISPELMINHTTPNYRSLHLQRLADPLLAWNPPPKRPDGSDHPQHDSDRPVNPYRTVDSMSIDVTAFNGINDDETRPTAGFRMEQLQAVFAGSRGAETLHEYAHFLPVHGVPLTGYDPWGATTGNDADKVLMTMSSQFRGFHEQQLTYGDEPGDGTAPEIAQTLAPGRNLWAQERPNQIIDTLDDRLDVFDTRPQTINPDGADTVHEDFNPRGPGPDGMAMNYPIRHTLGYDNLTTRRRIVGKPAGAITGSAKEFYPSKVELRGVFSSDLNESYEATAPVYPIDVNGDGVLGDLVGTARVNRLNSFLFDNPRTELDEDIADPADDANFEQDKPDYRDDMANPWLTWNSRPFASGAEAILAPAASSSRLMGDYSFVNPFELDPPSRYDGFAVLQPDGDLVGDIDDGGEWETNRTRLSAASFPYGHLLPVFFTSSLPASEADDPTTGAPVPVGAANFHRLIDYVHTPSRFTGTDLMLDPTVFNTDQAGLGDPREPFAAPFNRVAKYREPGKVNLNTIVGRRDPNEPNPVDERNVPDMWSDVYDGLMHRIDDANFINYGTGELIAMGHLGPAWRDVALSRRGYAPLNYNGGEVDYSPSLLHPSFPTRFANPFRAPSAGDMVPLVQMAQFGVDASLLRAHPFSPGANLVWGDEGDDQVVDKTGDGFADADLIENNAVEAGLGDDGLLFRDNGALPDSQKINPALADTIDPETIPVEPLFADGATEASLDAGRNPGIAYNPMTRLSNLTTNRSGVFAVWITVGFFEVTPAPDWNYAANNPSDSNAATVQANVRARFGNDQSLYGRVYHDGYQLGKELGIDTGNVQRFRGFWMIDRTRPVAFRPGENANTEQTILLERRIE